MPDSERHAPGRSRKLPAPGAAPNGERVGVLPSASFGQVVEQERRRAQRLGRDLSLCLFETTDPRGPRQLERLGLVFSRTTADGRVGWLGESRLCILVDGDRTAADRMARRLSRLNDALGGPALDASVWVYPSALQQPARDVPPRAEDRGAPDGLARGADERNGAPHGGEGANGSPSPGTEPRSESHWSLPLCW